MECREAHFSGMAKKQQKVFVFQIKRVKFNADLENTFLLPRLFLPVRELRRMVLSKMPIDRLRSRNTAS